MRGRADGLPMRMRAYSFVTNVCFPPYFSHYGWNGRKRQQSRHPLAGLLIIIADVRVWVESVGRTGGRNPVGGKDGRGLYLTPFGTGVCDMTNPWANIRQLSCQCGRVRCQATGAPIASIVCYCDDCQEGARRIEGLKQAPAFRDPYGGTPLLTYRDDRFECVSGQELLVGYRLSDNAPTRRMVASCCNSAIFLKFEPGFWVSTYRARFEAGDLPPIEMRNQVKHRQAGTPLPDDVPTFRSFPLRIYGKLFWARVCMLNEGQLRKFRRR